jgi:tRNA (cmo5U34)-methyltransferase
MTKFEKSEWIESGHVKDFVENADIYILERQRLWGVMKSFYHHFLKNKHKKSLKILDLGCGDGALINELLKADKKIEATLVDGSSEMLDNARKRLELYEGLIYIHTTFQDLLENDVLTRDFDFIISSLAIHHLYTEEKESLFNYIYHHLNLGGFFLNIDVVRAPTEELEEWYRLLWKEWIAGNEIKRKSKKSFQHLPTQYQNNPDNHPETLEKQLKMLISAGFKQVDCYYKYGIFSIYGGRK